MLRRQLPQTTKIMKNYLWFIAIVIIITCTEISQYAQTRSTIARKQVLRKNIIGKEFIYKYGDKNEVKLKYIGEIKSKGGKVYKFLNSIHVSGLYDNALRASCRILIYNEKNLYLGHYFVGSLWYLPEKVADNKMIFPLRKANCNQKTEISFDNGIPKELYVQCTEKGGDVFVFSRDQPD